MGASLRTARLRRRGVAELAIGAAVLVAFAWAGRPGAPAAASDWNARGVPVLVSLGRDVAAAASQPALTSRSRGRLRQDLIRAERTPPPPGPAAARRWASALRAVSDGLALAATDPGAARDDLNLAGLELTAMAGPGVRADSQGLANRVLGL